MTTGDVCIQDKNVDDENRMSMIEIRCRQNQQHKAEAITDDMCIMNEEKVEGLTRTRLRKLCCKMNKDRSIRVHENSIMCIVQ